jgi:hypothetical protein
MELRSTAARVFSVDTVPKSLIVTYLQLIVNVPSADRERTFS